MKKAQAKIITTVLIILLVLAAIFIVWQVVGETINQDLDPENDKKALCDSLDFIYIGRGLDLDDKCYEIEGRIIINEFIFKKLNNRYYLEKK